MKYKDEYAGIAFLSVPEADLLGPDLMLKLGIGLEEIANGY